MMLSLPSRGAWIEMLSIESDDRLKEVAPLAGSVDRNQQLQVQAMAGNGRSPRGERG